MEGDRVRKDQSEEDHATRKTEMLVNNPPSTKQSAVTVHRCFPMRCIRCKQIRIARTPASAAASRDGCWAGLMGKLFCCTSYTSATRAPTQAQIMLARCAAKVF